MNTHSETLHSIDPMLRDGYEVQVAALTRGLDVTLLPRQVLMVGSGNPIVGDASFVHGVPEASTVAGVTFAQDKRVRRAMLQRAGFTVPKGATFSIGKSAGAARRYAERIGYPVVIKPAMGDNTVGVLPTVTNSEGLRQAVQYLHTPVDDREDFTRASYAMTELREPGFKNGVEVAPPSYRFLVEKHVTGQYVRLLVLGDRVVNALHCQEGTWQTPGDAITDVTDRIHPSLGRVAVGASQAIPGLAMVALDLIVPDFTAEATAKTTTIVEYSERPWLEPHFTTDPQLAASLAAMILGYGLGGSVPEPSEDDVTVEAHIDGAVAPEQFAEALRVACRSLGIQEAVKVTDPALGHVEGRLAGSPRSIAWLTETALGEGLEEQRAMMALLRHV